MLYSLRYNRQRKIRIIAGVALILLLYVLPTALRLVLPGLYLYALGTVLVDAAGAIVIGFLTNNYPFGVYLYAAGTLLELAVVRWTGLPIAICVGAFTPAVVTIYFARQVYINTGD